jgi:SAM-dependent methyltransferase|uniref:methyltransferase domain-containing protein n=1 Tax=Cephaloticoccus sp. TaxID=1985742 RepID=UPI0040496DD5
MNLPIGGPRFWRRLVTRWWQPNRRMQVEWEQRAQSDAYGFIGRGYAENDHTFWASGEADVTQHILNGISVNEQTCALEIGCGVGRLMRPLAKRLAAINGVDIAPGMISKGRELLSDLPNARLEVTDGSLNMFPSQTLDYVYSFVVFQHIPSKRAISRYIQETARVLKPGGVFKFQVDGRERSLLRGADTWLGVWFKPNEIRQILQGAGFNIVDTWGEQTQYYWITACLKSGQSNPANATALPPQWNIEALGDLLNRLGQPNPMAKEAILSGRRSLREFSSTWLASTTRFTNHEFLGKAFETILGRPADEAGATFYRSQLAKGVSRAYLIDCLLSSAELRANVRQNPLTTP